MSALEGTEALLDTRTSIETPEHVVLSYHLAGPIRRGLAYLVDAAVRAALLFAVFMVLALSGAAHTNTWGTKGGLALLLLFLMEWGYFVVCEAVMSGRSPGKRALGLRVVTTHGLAVSLGDSVLRNLLRAADFLPVGYVLGVSCMLVGGQFRRLGDLVAGTLVVYERKADLKEPTRLSPPPSQAELSWLPARVELSEAERDAIELFMRRAGDLPPLRANELADILAEPLAGRLRLRYKHPARFLGLLYHCHIQGGA